MVKKNDVPIQIQTEYAVRPAPRISTTILNNGQVLHKIEKKLNEPIRSVEEQNRIENIINRQHAEIVSTIQNSTENFSGNIQPPQPSQVETPQIEQPSKIETSDNPKLSILERIEKINGVQKIYNLDHQGNFIGFNDSNDFRGDFAKVFKSLKDVMDVFTLLPNSNHREKGVFEVIRDRLYFISLSEECLFISVRRVDGTTVFEKAFQEILTEPGDFSL